MEIKKIKNVPNFLQFDYSQNYFIGCGVDYFDQSLKGSPFYKDLEVISKEKEKISNCKHIIITNYKEFAEACENLSYFSFLGWDYDYLSDFARKSSIIKYFPNQVLFIVQKRIQNESIGLEKSPSLTPLAARILKEKGKDKFNEVYGDFYIEELIRGSVINIVIRMKSLKILNSQFDLDPKLLEAFANFGLNLNSAENFKAELNKNSDLIYLKNELQCFSANENEKKIENLNIDNLNKFLLEFSFNNSNAIPLFFILKSHKILNDYIEISLFETKDEVKNDNNSKNFFLKSHSKKLELLIGKNYLLSALDIESDENLIELKNIFGIDRKKILNLKLENMEEDDEKIINLERALKKFSILKYFNKSLINNENILQSQLNFSTHLDYIIENKNKSFKIINIDIKDEKTVLGYLYHHKSCLRDHRDNDSNYVHLRNICSFNIGIKWKINIINEMEMKFEIIYEGDIIDPNSNNSDVFNCKGWKLCSHDHYDKDKRSKNSVYVCIHLNTKINTVWKIIPKGKYVEIIMDGNLDATDAFDIKGYKLEAFEGLNTDKRDSNNHGKTNFCYIASIKETRTLWKFEAID